MERSLIAHLYHSTTAMKSQLVIAIPTCSIVLSNDGNCDHRDLNGCRLFQVEKVVYFCFVSQNSNVERHEICPITEYPKNHRGIFRASATMRNSAGKSISFLLSLEFELVQKQHPALNRGNQRNICKSKSAFDINQLQTCPDTFASQLRN